MSAATSSPSEIEQLVARLRKVGPEIGKAASAGDELARRVISLYQMLHRRAEAATAALVAQALDDWELNRASAVASVKAPR